MSVTSREVLELALETWSRHRAPELSDFVVRLSDWAERELEAPSFATRSEAARTLEATTSVGLAKCLQALRTVVRTRGSTELALLLVDGRPADPRVGHFLLETLLRDEVLDLQAEAFWRHLARGLEKHGDASMAARIDGRATTPYGGLSVYRHDRFASRLGWLASKLRELPGRSKTAEVVLREVELSPQTTPKRALASVEAALAQAYPTLPLRSVSAARTEAELVEAVYAAPLDDAPRQVLADVLLERGDAWGELIALQLALARGEARRGAIGRERELVAQLEKRLLGPIAGSVLRPVFRRGFLAEAQLRPKSPKAALEAREWSTVETLHTSFVMPTHRGALRRLVVQEWQVGGPLPEGVPRLSFSWQALSQAWLPLHRQRLALEALELRLPSPLVARPPSALPTEPSVLAKVPRVFLAPDASVVTRLSPKLLLEVIANGFLHGVRELVVSELSVRSGRASFVARWEPHLHTLTVWLDGDEKVESPVREALARAKVRANGFVELAAADQTAAREFAAKHPHDEEAVLVLLELGWGVPQVARRVLVTRGDFPLVEAYLGKQPYPVDWQPWVEPPVF